jgi:hypothetical protein
MSSSHVSSRYPRTCGRIARPIRTSIAARMRPESSARNSML